jgi:hypothetical protein
LPATSPLFKFTMCNPLDANLAGSLIVDNRQPQCELQRTRRAASSEVIYDIHFPRGGCSLQCRRSEFRSTREPTRSNLPAGRRDDFIGHPDPGEPRVLLGIARLS